MEENLSDKEITLKGIEIKPNTFLISEKETAKLDKNTIYQITKIVINECKEEMEIIKIKQKEYKQRKLLKNEESEFQ
jgi:hypothetical protein